MAMWFAKEASYSHNPVDILAGKGGWAEGGVWPAQKGWPYFGMECGQGFLWSLLYGNSKSTANATAPLAIAAHLNFPAAMPRPAKLVDRCEYNYQREAVEAEKRKCKAAFKCSDVIFLHKFHDENTAEKHSGNDAVCSKPDYRPSK